MRFIITILLAFLTQHMDVVHDAANFDVLTDVSRQERVLDVENDVADQLYDSLDKEQIMNSGFVEELFSEPFLARLSDYKKDALRILFYRLKQREYYDKIASQVVSGYDDIDDSTLLSSGSSGELTLLIDKETMIHYNLKSLEMRKNTLLSGDDLKGSIRRHCRDKQYVLKVLQLKTTGFKGASAPYVSEKTEAAFHRFGNDRIKNHRKELLRGRDADIFDEEPILSRRRMTTK